MKLSIFCDGGARGNPGPAATGFVVKDHTGHILHQHSEAIGTATNNVAEYRAVLSALQWLIPQLDARRYQLDAVNFFLDSALVVNQLNGRFKIKSAHLRDLIVQVKILESKVTAPITYTAIPRTQNSQADSLVNQALDSSFL
ncbi:MAG: hypothetical protein A2784_03670 [Candidatus Chisholmbacteria bacterium RIFCSPHIGHO2_01_FULL_48_12]|uniref:RNase H type-1 domain-containing protein n=1 Tax=Candidatus Chisholmbacteria bacterium RIFCSPHIGHO2_01_FULL_48_12 TaxID=1797589 RepID=A0A1G1VPF4_9BACT|nr:MAG: hypothetical protein A2784_03670 [Candidatus Chisholmbacteria bacterium RIFCSPHIGHO2_01_FULL_48_12]